MWPVLTAIAIGLAYASYRIALTFRTMRADAAGDDELGDRLRARMLLLRRSSRVLLIVAALALTVLAIATH